MINSQTGMRELAYVVRINRIDPIENADRLELVHVNGWKSVCGKEQFHIGDLAVYFETDSQLPEVAPFTNIDFLASKHYKIKVQKIRGVISDGLLIPISDFGWTAKDHPEGTFVTDELNVTYNVLEDNIRKAPTKERKLQSIKDRFPKFVRNKYVRKLMKYEWFRNLIIYLFPYNSGEKEWPVGRFEGVTKTDQERVENMPWVLEDKGIQYILTEKCDGSSATYILERKKNGKFEFYVCSRNVRMMKQNQDCFYDSNIYWEMAKKYDIEAKMKAIMKSQPEMTFICWQGEICGPKIQKNPHGLNENHLYLFHWTDSIEGRMRIDFAIDRWRLHGLETVPMLNMYTILTDTMEEEKVRADGFYDSSVTGDNEKHPREGLVYYSRLDPYFSFKNVSNSYRLNHTN